MINIFAEAYFEYYVYTDKKRHTCMLWIGLARGASEVDGVDHRDGEASNNAQEVDPEHPGPFGGRGGGVGQTRTEAISIAAHGWRENRQRDSLVYLLYLRLHSLLTGDLEASTSICSSASLRSVSWHVGIVRLATTIRALIVRSL